jgi:hypothetical protein
MDNAPQVIRQHMQQRRAALSEKLETLENQVVQTVHEATTAVHDTVANIKDSIQGTVQGVRDACNVRLQVERHPWPMMAGSVLVGYTAGALLPGLAKERLQRQEPSVSRLAGERETGHERTREGAPVRTERHSWLSRLGESLAPEIAKLRGLALGAVMGVVRDAVKGAAPGKFRSQLHGILDDVTAKLGGEPVPGRTLSEPEPRADFEERYPGGTGRRWG